METTQETFTKGFENLLEFCCDSNIHPIAWNVTKLGNKYRFVANFSVNVWYARFECIANINGAHSYDDRMEDIVPALMNCKLYMSSMMSYNGTQIKAEYTISGKEFTSFNTSFTTALKTFYELEMKTVYDMKKAGDVVEEPVEMHFDENNSSNTSSNSIDTSKLDKLIMLQEHCNSLLEKILEKMG